MAEVSSKPTPSQLIESISEQLGMVCGDDGQVRQDCASFARLISHPPRPSQGKYLKELARLLTVTDDFIALPVYELLAGFVGTMEKPWPLLKILLHAAEEGIAKLVVELALQLVNEGRLGLDQRLLGEFAVLQESEFSPFEDEDVLDQLVATVLSFYSTDKGDALLALFRKNPDRKIRKLAAIMLDNDGEMVSASVARSVLGKKAHSVLAPFLEYTRASHMDLYSLSGGKKLSRRVVDLFRSAQDQHGEVLVRQAVAAVGWANVSLGLRMDKLIEIIPPGSLPLLVSADEAFLFRATEALVGREFHLITTHGGTGAKASALSSKSDPVDRFRVLNITHAELLGEILDVVPLDKAKVERINTHLDSVVETYASLFSDLSEDCAILPDLWRELRGRVVDSLAHEPETGPLSAELTRLVLAFEDPTNLGEVRSVHGLKRYLHQAGLKLGFKMVDTSHAPNRTVDLLLVKPDGSVVSSKTIRYAEFEAGIESEPDRWLPYPVRVVAEGLSRQLLYGTETFPSVDVFIFGNEVHYYLAFRNHPAFLRVDYSPPQRGGMLDLEYYGVSNYESDMHPNVNLDAIRLFFRKLDFDVRLEGMRLFVRYDKERSNSLGDLCDHVAALFRMAPFLMDIDWIIGSLQLSQEARVVVAENWADRFCHSGVLPVTAILNQKRHGVLVDFSDGPTGVQEILWDGLAPYSDRYSQNPSVDFYDRIFENLAGLSIPVPTFGEDAPQGPLPLLEFEKSILGTVGEALHLGRIVRQGDELRPVPEELFQTVHEAEHFANLLSGDVPDLMEACLLARPLAELERFVEFIPTGFVGGLVVERARVTVLGGELTVFVVRDAHGVIRLGTYSLDSRLVRRRRRHRDVWCGNDLLNVDRLWALLHSANYLTGALCLAGSEGSSGRDLADLRAQAALGRPVENHPVTDGERILKGLKAAPGRAVGRVLFGTEGRLPKDLDGAVLVARKVCPTDNQYLCRSVGIVSTGGAVLSHAALLAIQFGIPAMVAEGVWDEAGGVPTLRFLVSEYRERVHTVADLAVCEREVVQRHSHVMVEGDLVVLDANKGSVQVIGQDRDTLGLWDGMRLLGEAAHRADLVLDDVEVLEVRAQQLRARHQIQKILDRLADPVLTGFAVEEIVVGETMAKVLITDKIRLLSRILANPLVARAARTKLHEICVHLADCCATAERAASEQIPDSNFLYEILGLRLRALRWREALVGAVTLLKRFGMEKNLPDCFDQMIVCELARNRLDDLRRELLDQLPDSGFRARHLQRRIGRIGTVLGTRVPRPELIIDCQENLAQADSRSLNDCKNELVLNSRQCGLEMHSCIGWKAANLGEIDRLVGEEAVPLWFVVTNFAFNRILKQPVGSAEYLGAGVRTLAGAIQFVLSRDDLDNKAKSQAIERLWVDTSLPEDLRRAVKAGHTQLMTENDCPDAFVALRSSSCDEDTETVMRAGEFESYLFVRGHDSLLEHLLLTWSGLWTERAIFSRENEGDILQWPSGGVIVQRMVQSRVSGVLQTVNVARGDLREVLINASLGLGEGIVSGLVAADLVTVVKDFGPGEDPTHLNYLTNDKPEQMVFDQRRGWGTRLVETLYHQRLRPALEYFELCEIVAKACALESGYGYPLDIEFALEGSRLWLLQARPIATFRAELRKTVEQLPLHGKPGVLK